MNSNRFFILYMAKDPAFLFYPGDWLGGTMYMTMQQKGCYISLLMLQFNTGPFTIAQAEQVLSICFASDWDMIKSKFSTDGVFYWNERLKIEKELRQSFTNSRRINALGEKSKPKKDKAYAKHMNKHMEDENEDVNKDRKVLKKDAKIEFSYKVKLTQEEYDKLDAEYGNSLKVEAIEFLSSYKQEKGYTTKSDYLTIRRWVIDAVKKQKNGSNQTGNSAAPYRKPTGGELQAERLAESLRRLNRTGGENT